MIQKENVSLQVKKLKRASWAMKHDAGDHFETENSAEIASAIRPRWPKLMTILVWAHQRPSQVEWIEEVESQAHAASAIGSK